MTEKNFFAAYAPLRDYVAPLRPELWRLVVGIGLIMLINMIGGVLFFMPFGGINEEEMGRTPGQVVLFLSGFSVLILAVVLAALWPAQRPIASLIGPLPAAWRDFRRVLVVMVPPIAVLCFLTIALDPTFTPNQPLSKILPWLPLALLALMIQISAEELVFRGYIMGQLAARSANPLIWMGLPAVIFGALHYDPGSYGGLAWIVCLNTMLFAVIASDLTARTGNLGAAIAMHFANNFAGFLVVGEKGRFDGLSLYAGPMDLTDWLSLAIAFGLLLVMWVAARWALRV